MVWFGKCEPVGYLLTPESSFAGSVSLFFFWVYGLWLGVGVLSFLLLFLLWVPRGSSNPR